MQGFCSSLAGCVVFRGDRDAAEAVLDVHYLLHFQGSYLQVAFAAFFAFLALILQFWYNPLVYPSLNKQQGTLLTIQYLTLLRTFSDPRAGRSPIVVGQGLQASTRILHGTPAQQLHRLLRPRQILPHATLAICQRMADQHSLPARQLGQRSLVSVPLQRLVLAQG
eukprot:767978-Hanusia_phi.AAC.5